MKIKLFHLDAFADRLFAGNPAAVCPLEDWLPESTMQAIAAENNLSETAFFVGGDGKYHIRWFTPIDEIKLCGHGTLAAGYVVLNYLEPKQSQVIFSSASGSLTVRRQEDEYFQLDFPVRTLDVCDVPEYLAEGLGMSPLEVYRSSNNYLVVLSSEHQVKNLIPDLSQLKKLDLRGVIVSAPGKQVDFVSRYFVPKIPKEDPVTGSVHCTLVPYWAKRLGKTKLHAQQLSWRGGYLLCELGDDRVYIGGKVVPYLIGEIEFSHGT